MQEDATFETILCMYIHRKKLASLLLADSYPNKCVLINVLESRNEIPCAED